MLRPAIGYLRHPQAKVVITVLVLGIGTWLVGIPLLILVVAVYFAYIRSKEAKGEAAPPETQDRTQPPVDRAHEWDPKDRYSDGEPPAAR